MLRVVELFAGVGAQHQALKNLGIPHEIVAISEIDKYAIAAYTAIHGPVNNLGDIRKIEHLPPCDLVTYSFPCQDLSKAGKGKGMMEKSNTRSSLLWQVGRLLDDLGDRGCLPEYLLMENVDEILTAKHKPQFLKWIIKLNELGYNSSYKVVNALDHGVPQNRKRCFMISTLSKGCFIFPGKQPLKTILRDYLDKNVDDSFYLKENDLRNYYNITKKEKSKDLLIVAGNLGIKNRYEQVNRVYADNGTCPTINAHEPPIIKEVGKDD